MVSISFMFIHAHDYLHSLCIAHCFSGGLIIWGLFLCFSMLSHIYFNSLIRFIPSSGFLISCIKTRVALICREQLDASVSTPHLFKLKSDQRPERLIRAWLGLVKDCTGVLLLFSAAGTGREPSSLVRLWMSCRFEDHLSIIEGWRDGGRDE